MTDEGREKDGPYLPVGVAGMPEYILYTVTKTGTEQQPEANSVGKYRAVLTMWRGTVRPVKEYELDLGESLVGDSHMRMAGPSGDTTGPPKARLRVTLLNRGERFELLATPNSNGFFGKLEVLPFDARDFSDAHEKANRAASAMLSRLSVQLDIPCMVFQIVIYEVGTGNRWMSMVNPYFEIPAIMRPDIPGTREFEAYASIYREAVNSNSPLYQFLCFYKIAEGITKRRVAKARAARKKGTTYKVPREVVPSDSAEFEPWLTRIFVANPGWSQIHTARIFRKDAIGKRFEEIVGKGSDLWQLRNEIAHAFTDSRQKEVANLDDEDFYTRVHGWLPLLKCIARRMLRDEFPEECLAGLNSDLEARAKATEAE
jgi:hypothetical protein